MKEITIPIKDAELFGYLTEIKDSIGCVLFIHGSGSSRQSPRNQYVAKVLQEGGISTLLFDLLTQEEEKIDDVTRELRFNIPMLAERTIQVTKWISPQMTNLGYFGASTGAAAALIAAAEEPGNIKAVVSRGGRPDLAASALKKVKAPTLCIVGGNDLEVLDLNKQALAKMTCEKKLIVIPGATHLFEEPGTLEEAATAARDWFKKCLK